MFKKPTKRQMKFRSGPELGSSLVLPLHIGCSLKEKNHLMASSCPSVRQAMSSLFPTLNSQPRKYKGTGDQDFYTYSGVKTEDNPH